MLSRLNAALYKYYFLTWLMILILFKRTIPKWMIKNVKDNIELPMPLGEVEKYVR